MRISSPFPVSIVVTTFTISTRSSPGSYIRTMDPDHRHIRYVIGLIRGIERRERKNRKKNQ